MLYMVIERFKQGPDPVRQRFAEKGRMLPEGVRYVDSWIEQDGNTCYQVMESDGRQLFDQWIAN